MHVLLDARVEQSSPSCQSRLKGGMMMKGHLKGGDGKGKGLARGDGVEVKRESDHASCRDHRPRLEYPNTDREMFRFGRG